MCRWKNKQRNKGTHRTHEAKYSVKFQRGITYYVHQVMLNNNEAITLSPVDPACVAPHLAKAQAHADSHTSSVDDTCVWHVSSLAARK